MSFKSFNCKNTVLLIKILITAGLYMYNIVSDKVVLKKSTKAKLRFSSYPFNETYEVSHSGKIERCNDMIEKSFQTTLIESIIKTGEFRRQQEVALVRYLTWTAIKC